MYKIKKSKNQNLNKKRKQKTKDKKQKLIETRVQTVIPPNCIFVKNQSTG